MTHLPVHRCEYRLCQSPEPHPDQAFHHYMNVFLSRLNEPQRRWFVALEAMRFGHGGKHLLAQITGMSSTTILRGRHELEADLAGCPELHMRAPGAGRPAAEERDLELEQALEMVLALETAGDPMGRRPKAKRSSLQHLTSRPITATRPTEDLNGHCRRRAMGASAKCESAAVTVLFIRFSLGCQCTRRADRGIAPQ